MASEEDTHEWGVMENIPGTPDSRILNAQTLLDLLREDRPPPKLVWVYEETKEWLLCCFCSKCRACMEYPGAAHNCPEGNEPKGQVIKKDVIQLVETDIEDLTDWLRCDEDFLGSER